MHAIPAHAIGELWPFHAAATHRVLMALGRQQEARHYIETLESMPLPRSNGSGFSGSVIPVCASMNALVSGNIAEAREQIERADPDLLVVRIVDALGELVSGRPRETLRRVVGLHTDVQHLHTLNIWRLAVTASAHLVLGEQEECIEILEFALRVPEGLRPEDLKWFSREMLQFAGQRVDGWPSEAGSELGAYTKIEPVAVLTAREVDVLRALASERSREEIAAEQFISLNTL